MSSIKRIAFGALVVALLPVFVLLLPILLPALAAADAWEVRRLTRTRCAACGAAIGRSEILRARLAARAKGRDILDSMLALGRRPRVVVTWDVTCPACRQAYEYRPDRRPPTLVAKA